MSRVNRFLQSRSTFVASCVAGVLAAGVVGCASEPGTDSSGQEGVVSTEATQALSVGALAYEGIFFGEGKYAANLSRVWNKESAPFLGRADYLKGVDTVISTINKSNPSYFATFEKQIFSKDPVQVNAALTAAIRELNVGVSGLPSNAGQDIYKTENIAWKNDVVYETTRVVHGTPSDFEDPYALKELVAVVVQTFGEE
ncbi:MAG TPA: hypothetical protein VNO21_02395 [Polyangiaceae bacterium]|nr:hypothetical protein [Polyangiaceae bacterium]